MRTTLKRGIGRGATANGNGRAVLPPTFRAPQAFTLYRQPRPRHTFAGLLAALLGWLLVAIVTAGAGLAGGAYLYFHEAVRDIAAHTPELKLAQEQLDIVPPDAPAIALVIGVDHRQKGVDANEEGRPRSDTLLLLRADPRQRALSMLSFPRDLYVPIVCPNRGTFNDRINEAFSQCGPRGAVETVRHLTGLPINYVVTVNFVGFVQLVAQLGGVWMDVDRRYFNPPGTGYAAIDLHAGYQRLNGRQALSFVRYRHADSDIYRLARQQRFMHAFKQAVTSYFSPTKLLKISSIVRDNVEVAGKGFDGNTLVRWGYFAYELPSGHVFQTKIDVDCYRGGDAVTPLTVDSTCMKQAVDDFSRPDVEAPGRAAEVALGMKPKDAAPPPGKTTVVVLNGTTRDGFAADTSYQLTELGYATRVPANDAPANAPTHDYTRTKIFYDDARPPAKRAARKLVRLFGGERDVDAAAMPTVIQPLAGDAMVVVVLGTNFSGQVAGASAEEPERKPPAVVTNPDATLASVREARRRVKFPVLVPTKLERTSTLSSDEGMRIYKMAGHPTVRFTYVTGASEYWGIQMVRWRRAPALRQPNETVTIKGRRYDLYLSGTKLEMVVLHHRNTTYWVTNTLLGTLSNETMLAIARGLKPRAR